jgi:surface polysaccharide O-acyltransferase-like enzyme
MYDYSIHKILNIQVTIMRRHSVDWLRNIGILMLFPFHTARVFDHWEINYIKDTPDWFCSWFIAGTSVFFMPLLFLLAGISAYFALQKRTSKEFIRERIHRLLIPLIVGLVLIVPPQAYFAKLQAGYTGGYLSFLSSYFFDFHDISGYTGGFTPAHLWFILYLFIISLALLPLLYPLRKRQQLSRFLNNPRMLLWAFLPLTITQVLPSPGGKNIFYYAVFFLVGYIIAGNENYFAFFTKHRQKTLAASVVLLPGYYMVLSALGWPTGYTVITALLELARNFTIMLNLMTLLGYAEKYLQKGGKLLSYLSRAAFPVYILHQTVLIIIAYFVVALPIALPFKFLLIMFGALAGSFAGFEICKRMKWTRIALGIK